MSSFVDPEQGYLEIAEHLLNTSGSIRLRSCCGRLIIAGPVRVATKCATCGTEAEAAEFSKDALEDVQIAIRQFLA